jgi:hypothetical protein
MTIVPPVEQFSNNYTFSTLTTMLEFYDDDFDHYLNVIIATEYANELILDGQLIETAAFYHNWTRLLYTNYSFATFTLTQGLHEIYHPDGAVGFGAAVYGLKFQESYGHPLGQNMEVREGDR